MPLRRFILWIAGFVLLSCSLLHAQPNCSASMLVGTYAVRGNFTAFVTIPGSTQPMAVPGVEVGIASVDYNFRATAHLFGTQGGQPTDSNVTATIDIASNCTGVLKYQFVGQNASGSNRMLIVDGGNTVYTLAEQATGVQVNGGEIWQRISTLPLDYMSAVTPCTSDMLHGTYGFVYDGNMIMTLPGSTGPVPLPFYMLGLSWTDRTGRNTGTYIANVGGTTAPAAWTTTPGATKVNADCTGSTPWSLTGTDATSAAGLDRFVILNGGKEFWSATVQGVMGAPSFVGIFKRISEQPMQ